MRYLHVTWFHEKTDDPLELYSELDEEAWEVRKVEVFRDGKLGFAGSKESSDSTSLGLEPVPTLEEISSDSQFLPKEISKAEFEQMWDLARTVAVTSLG